MAPRWYKQRIVDAGKRFVLHSDFKPAGDQPKAIEELARGVLEGKKHQVLLGVTGSGKTFTIANVIERVQRPTLVIAHNKTLAAQLCAEFRALFPENAVEYFVSYYDYYQPEAYKPATDTYIEKDAQINDEIDRLRHAATQAVSSRRDVIVVASVSCIFGIGSPEIYQEIVLSLQVGDEIDRDEILRQLVAMQFTRSQVSLSRGRFRARGDVVEIYPADQEAIVRVEMFGDEVDRITVIDPLTGEVVQEPPRIDIYPATHWVATEARLLSAIEGIEAELEERLKELRSEGKLLEAQRLEQRTRYDLEMLREIGYCQGIENYSRYFDGREPGEPPYTLMDYFPDDYLLIIDESHQTIPQIRGMYYGDHSRKVNLVEYGFRLPSAFDNRPLTFEEFEERVNQVIYTSATPGPYELEKCGGKVVEQIIRPTGLVDPEIDVRPTEGQIDDLIGEIKKRVEKNQRVLVTTLTKRMAEDLAEYLSELGMKVRYLHSEVRTLDRGEILRDLRLGEFDVLVGINLLREGLDLPEVSLVAILDADAEGYLRSTASLIQIMGRAARNVEGKVIMYADTITEAMREAIDETNRRRRIQMEYNRKHNITPATVVKAVQDTVRMREAVIEEARQTVARIVAGDKRESIEDLIASLEKEMREAAERLEFEKAAEIRDELAELRKVAASAAQRARSGD